jgi:hypothetical protein
MRTEDASTVEGSRKESEREKGCMKEKLHLKPPGIIFKGQSIGATFRLLQLATLAGLGACAGRKPQKPAGIFLTSPGLSSLRSLLPTA